MKSDPIPRFVSNLFAAFAKPMKRDTMDFYIERLGRWGLTDNQWSRALSWIVGDRDGFPTLAQIYPYLVRAKLGTRSEVEAVYRTWCDSDGRIWAQPTGQVRSVWPDRETMEQWRREACSTEEGKAAFWTAFREAAAEAKVRQEAFDQGQKRKIKSPSSSSDGLVSIVLLLPGVVLALPAASGDDVVPF